MMIIYQLYVNICVLVQNVMKRLYDSEYIVLKSGKKVKRVV